MTTDLEEQLADGMREYAHGLSPAGDVVAAAARRHRRGTAVRRSAYVGGVTTLAAALVIGLTATGPTGPGADSGRTAPAVLTVAEVSTRTTAALADSEKMIEHVVVRLSVHGRGSEDEVWYDPGTGSWHRVGPGAPGLTAREVWATPAGGTVRYAMVDRSRRVWSSYSRTAPEGRGFEGVSPSTPAQIRAALAKGGGGLVLVGPEQIDGRATLHLTVPGKAEPGSDDLWVDADTYQVVRRVVVKRDPGGDATVREDFEWLKRTPGTLATVTFVPPAGFAHVPADAMSAPPSPSADGHG